MIIVITISSIVIMAGGVAFYRSFSAVLFIAGVAAMTIVNILKVFLIERTVDTAITHQKSSEGKNYVRLQYVLRFFLTGAVLIGIVLVTSHTEDFAAVFGGAIGAITLQIGAISLKFMKFEDTVAVTAEKEGENSEL